MRLESYLAKSRIIDLHSRDLKGALDELLHAALERLAGKHNRRALLRELLQREDRMATYLGSGLAMPYLRIPKLGRYILAVGRCPQGIEYEGSPESHQVRLLILLLAPETGQHYLTILNALARLLDEKAVVDSIIEAPSADDFCKRVYQVFGGTSGRPRQRQNPFNRLLFKEAEKIAKEIPCSAVLIFSDTFEGGIEPSPGFPRHRTIIVAESESERFRYQKQKNVQDVIGVHTFSQQRLAQLRSAVLIGLTRGLFQYNDSLCCVTGVPGSNRLDTLVVVDIEREFQSVLTRETDLLPASAKVEVIERILGIATELAVEGREGRPVGSIFVIGDVDKINALVKPLVLNPFYGYKEEDRNVLNPFMDETIKELSCIDGAFIIRGNGVIESAGALLHAPVPEEQCLPSGFGARHAAAASMSRVTDCVAIVVSASTGQVSLFRKGVMIPLLEKTVAAKL